MSDIFAYKQTIGGHTSYYCEKHVLHILFNGKINMLEAVKDGSDVSFIDDDGFEFEIIHEGTVQYEQYPGEILPLEGIYCKLCGAELVEPFEPEEDIC